MALNFTEQISTVANLKRHLLDWIFNYNFPRMIYRLFTSKPFPNNSPIRNIMFESIDK